MASVFRNLLALFLLVLIVDFLLLLQCGWAVFWRKTFCPMQLMLLILFALQEIYIPIVSDLFPLFPFVDGEAISGVFGSEGSD